MNKQEFLAAVRARIDTMPAQDIRRSIDYYAEMIDDRMEDGLSEAEAVAAMGSAEEIAAQILGENLPPPSPPSPPSPPPTPSKRSWRAWEIALLVLGFPLWFPLLLAGAGILLSLYAVLWSVILALYAAVIGLAAGALGGIVCAPILFCTRQGAMGFLLLGGAFVLAGLTVLGFIGTTLAAKVAWWLTKLPFPRRKENKQ